MKFLALDTSSNWTILALGENDVCLQQECFLAQQNQSSLLLPLIEKLFHHLNLSIHDLDAFAVVQGPGSFTGLRVGISTIKGFAMAHPKPIAPLHALEFQAESSSGGFVAPTTPSRRGFVFGAIYEKTPELHVILKPAEYALDFFNSEVAKKHAVLLEPQQFDGKDLITHAWKQLQQSKTTDAFGLQALYLIDEVAKVKATT